METFLLVSNVLLWVFMIAQIGVMVLLARLVAQFLNGFRAVNGRVEPVGLPIGERAPLFRGRDLEGRSVRLADLAGQTTLLLFASPTCGVCHEVAAGLGPILHRFEMRALVVVAKKGGAADTTLSVPAGVPVLLSDEVIDMYRVREFPTAVLVGATGTILLNERISNLTQLSYLLEQGMKRAG
jgi:hypothetical protein